MIVRKLRLHRGWTQSQLAELAGLSVRSIQRIERGQPAGLETLKSLAAVFEVDLSVLQQTGGHAMGNDMKLSEEEISAMKYVKGLKEFWSHLLMYVTFALTFMIAIGPSHPIILWGAIGWGIGVLIHGLVAYEVINIFSPNWERKLIEKRLGRKL